jgi:hypothetical protein
VHLESDLPENALQGVYWKVIGWYFLLAIVLSIFIGIGGTVILYITGASHQPRVAGADLLSRNIPLLVMTTIGYLALILSLNVVLRVYLVRDVWAKVLQSVRVLDISAAADVAAKGDLASALGEGFADGLDVAGF